MQPVCMELKQVESSYFSKGCPTGYVVNYVTTSSSLCQQRLSGAPLIHTLDLLGENEAAIDNDKYARAGALAI